MTDAQPSPLAKALEALLNPSSLDDHLISAAADTAETAGEGPRTTLLHLRFNEDIPKVDALARHLWEECFYYALPRRRQEAFRKEIEKNPSVAMRVGTAVRDSFIAFNEKNPTRASEVAEVLAYCVVQHHLAAAQVVAKMGLKTSSNMPVHGLDGIHAKFENGALTVYFLEAKLAGSANSGARDYAESAAHFLQNQGQYLREYQIVAELGNLDALDEPERQLALDHFDILGKPTIQHRERYVGIICYSEKKYAKSIPVSDGPVDAHEKHFSGLYTPSHDHHRKAAAKHLTANGAKPAKCIVFFVAVPDVNELRKKFYQVMGVPMPDGMSTIEDIGDEEANAAQAVADQVAAGTTLASVTKQ